MRRLVTIVCASLFVPLMALADPQTADDWYKQGENEYNLGNFEKAAEAFKSGYALETNEGKKPVYLYNVAQAYRQANKCKDAEFFYKRFLSLKDQDTAKPLKASTRAEIEQWIAQLEDCVKQQDAIAKRPPDGVAHPDGGDTTKTGSGSASGSGSGSGKVASNGSDDGSDDDDGGGVTKRVTTGPKVLSARFTAGISKISAGDTPVPVQPTFALFGGYPLHLNPKLELDIGALLSFTPVPFQNTMTGASSTGNFISAYADAGAEYQVAPKIDVRGDLGLGLLVFGGISDMGNPFTQGGAATSGSLTMFSVRVAAAGEYEITQNLIATLTPAFAYSPAKSGLRDDIKSITHIDFMLGIGYRM